jgi:hypothetical protein
MEDVPGKVEDQARPTDSWPQSYYHPTDFTAVLELACSSNVTANGDLEITVGSSDDTVEDDCSSCDPVQLSIRSSIHGIAGADGSGRSSVPSQFPVNMKELLDFLVRYSLRMEVWSQTPAFRRSGEPRNALLAFRSNTGTPRVEGIQQGCNCVESSGNWLRSHLPDINTPVFTRERLPRRWGRVAPCDVGGTYPAQCLL